MRTRIKHAVMCGWLLAAAAPLMAAEPGRGITGAEVVSILQAEGYKAKLETDSDGDPIVRTAMQGVTASVLFYDCKDGRCGSLQLRAGLDLSKGVSLETVERFNHGFRYGSAYRDDEQDPFLKYDFEVLHTQHAEHIASQLDMWDALLGEFLNHTGFNDPAAASP